MTPMTFVKTSFKSLTKFELTLWICSVIASLSSYFASGNSGLVSVLTSVIGATALIFAAKGNVLGQILAIIFALMYSIISLTFRYYGEMITYAFMTLPMAILSLISWLKNPFSENEVKVNVIHRRETAFMFFLTGVITFIFYFILKYLNTPNLLISTLSVTTSFLACYLVFRRSEYYALAYGANDIVLITLWILASIQNPSYIPMIICFLMFLANDIYGFVNWRQMKLRQKLELSK